MAISQATGKQEWALQCHICKNTQDSLLKFRVYIFWCVIWADYCLGVRNNDILMKLPFLYLSMYYTIYLLPLSRAVGWTLFQRIFSTFVGCIPAITATLEASKIFRPKAYHKSSAFLTNISASFWKTFFYSSPQRSEGNQTKTTSILLKKKANISL